MTVSWPRRWASKIRYFLPLHGRRHVVFIRAIAKTKFLPTILCSLCLPKDPKGFWVKPGVAVEIYKNPSGFHLSSASTTKHGFVHDWLELIDFRNEDWELLLPMPKSETLHAVDDATVRQSFGENILDLAEDFKMKRQSILNCMFSSWYPKFKNITIRSRIIPLPKEFIDYLKADSVVLPEEHTRSETEANTDSDNDTDEWQALEEDPDQETATAPEFNEIDSRIKEVTGEFDGAVFPKLNWSSPLDASWISLDGTLKSSRPSDVYLLLKSSDRIASDLCESFKHCEDGEGEMSDGFELVLRKWVEISPGMEFRCFVKNNQLVAISQRDTSSFYKFIEEHENDICEEIFHFYNNKIANKFPDKSFVFDVYRESQEKLLLIDFGPFGAATDSLLFSWSEIENLSVDCNAEEFGGQFRFICDEAGVQLNPYHRNRMPTDIIDLACGNDINKLVDFLQVGNLIRRPGSNSND